MSSVFASAFSKRSACAANLIADLVRSSLEVGNQRGEAVMSMKAMNPVLLCDPGVSESPVDHDAS